MAVSTTQLFKVHRGTTLFTANATAVTIVEGRDYSLQPTTTINDAFITLTNSRLSGMGASTAGGSNNIDTFMVTIGNPDNLLTSISFSKATAAASNKLSRVSWEILEYIGPPSNANEIIVRGAGVLETAATSDLTVDGSTITTISDEDKVCIFITGQSADISSTQYINAAQFTAELIASGDDWIPRFTRGYASSPAADGRVSYAVVEFLGSNWRDVQRIDTNTKTGLNWSGANPRRYGEEALTTQLLDSSKAFMHRQYRYTSTTTAPRVAGDILELTDSLTTMRVRRNNTATESSKYDIVWVIENTQDDAGSMEVNHHSSYESDNTGPEEKEYKLTVPSVDRMDNASLMGCSQSSNDSSHSNFPRGFSDFRLTKNDEVTRTVCDSDDEDNIYFDVVEWPRQVTGVVALQAFKTHRGSTTLASSGATVTITEGVDYSLDASTTINDAFIRLTNTRHSGMGKTSGGGNQNSDDYTVTVQNPDNLLTSITFDRLGTSGDCRISWEIIEYIGLTGGDNKIIVRDVGKIVTSATTDATIDGATISTIDDKNKACIFITGQRTEDTFRNYPHSGYFTAEFIASGDDWIPRFTRGEDRSLHGHVSYAVVEFTGDNWRNVTRDAFDSDTGGPYWYTSSNGPLDCHTVDISVPLLNSSKAFIEPQYRVQSTGSQGIDDLGENIELGNSLTEFVQRRRTVTNDHLKFHVVWIIENTQNAGLGDMHVQHYEDYKSSVSGSEEQAYAITVSEVSSMDNTSVLGLSASADGSGNGMPRGFIDVRLTAADEVTFTTSDVGQEERRTFSVVEWPKDIPIYTDKTIPIEHLLSAPTTTPFGADKTISLEHLIYFSRDNDVPLEHLRHVSVDNNVPLEHLRHISIDNNAPLEHLGHVSIDNNIPLEHLLNVAINSNISFEYLLNIAISNNISLEHLLTTVATDKTIPIEHLLNVSVDSSTPIEYLLNIALSSDTPLEHLIHSSITKNIPLEHLINVSTDISTPVEKLLGMSKNGVFYIEWSSTTAPLVANKIVILEHLLGGPPSLLKWTLDSRGTSWTVNSRAVLWTLDTRTTLWKPTGRGIQWTLDSRGTTWTIN